MTSRRRERVVPEPFIRSLARRIDRVADALRHALSPGSAAPAGRATATGEPLSLAPAEQQALLWGFALLVARCPAGRGLSQPPAAGLMRVLETMAATRRVSADVGRAVDDLSSKAATIDVDALMAEAGCGGGAGQPLVDVFEHLLSACNRDLRRRRGVFFTPQPVVQFIVRSVDEMLRNELNLDAGLTTRTAPLRIIDPACGAGAFLLGVVDHVVAAASQPRQSSGHRQAIAALARDLIGIDVMPACCGAAALLLERALGVEWSAWCRNPLEEDDFSRSLFFHSSPPGRESERVGEEACMPIVIGNPPYRIFGRSNRGAWILEQLNAYKSGLNEKKLNLDDDFIKFLRWGQYWIDQTGRGVLAMITNNTYLTGLTHRQMRASLMRSFDRIFILDLHGSRKKRESSPMGGLDENVFPIQQGVAIGLFVKTGRRNASPATRIGHAELWGSRDEKMRHLTDRNLRQWTWTELPAQAPNYFFVRRREPPEEYLQWCRMDELFCRYVSGVQTKRDALFVGFTADEVAGRMKEFLGNAGSGRFPRDVPAWLRRKAVGVEFDARLVRPYMVAPFDVRWIYYEPRLLGRARRDVMQHLGRENLAIVFMRQTTSADPYDHFLVTNILVSDRLFYSAHGAPFVAPLFLGKVAGRATNLNRSFADQLARRVGWRFDEGENSEADTIRPRDVFYWMYGVMHSREYRARFREELRVDFPRIPLPGDRDLFRQVTGQGRILVDAHLNVLNHATSLAAPCSAVPAPAGQTGKGYPRREPWGRIAIGPDLHLPGTIEAEVWEFRLGGYAVLPRWLKQRRSQALTADQLEHFTRIVRTIRQTLSTMASIEPLPWRTGQRNGRGAFLRG